MTTQEPASPLTLSEVIGEYVAVGYQVRALTPSTASLVRPRAFNVWLCVLLLGILYIPFYMGKRDEVIFLDQRDGTVHSTGTAAPPADTSGMTTLIIGAYALVALIVVVAIVGNASDSSYSSSSSNTSAKVTRTPTLIPLIPTLPFAWGRDIALALDGGKTPDNVAAARNLCADGTRPDVKQADQICDAVGKGDWPTALKRLDRR